MLLTFRIMRADPGPQHKPLVAVLLLSLEDATSYIGTIEIIVQVTNGLTAKYTEGDAGPNGQYTPQDTCCLVICQDTHKAWRLTQCFHNKVSVKKL